MTNRIESSQASFDIVATHSGGAMRQYLVFVILTGNKTKRLKGHIIPKRISASDINEAVCKATRGKVFEEEGFEIIAIENM